LLRDHDGGYSGKSTGPAAQRQGSGDRRHLGESRIGRDQDIKPCGNIGLGVYPVVPGVAAWAQEQK